MKKDIGRVFRIQDGIVRIFGMQNVIANEMLIFNSGVRGLALNLEINSVGALIFGLDRFVNAKDYVFRTGKLLNVPVGFALLGRVIDPLGECIDGKGSIVCEWSRPIEKKAPGIVERVRIQESLETGIKVIDSLVPIGKGQRELILGDRQSGKTSLAIDTIIHQMNKFKKCIEEQKNIDLVLCVYVAIGQRQASVARIADLLSKKGCMRYTTIISATASVPMGMQYIAPYSGVTICEEWMDGGFDVLVIYDDLSKHAVVYRQMSLLLGRAPGREAYPGDVFYLHSRLLERAVKLRNYVENKGGSITALPIVETVEGDVSAYIPTNIISITDGQIYLDSGYFSKGIRPAINPGLSVSRVGSAAQNKLMRKIAGSLKLELAQFREVEEFTKFGSSVDEITRKLIARGQRLVELLIQPTLNPLFIEKQILCIYVGVMGFLDNIDLSLISKYENELYVFSDRVGLFDYVDLSDWRKILRSFTYYFSIKEKLV